MGIQRLQRKHRNTHTGKGGEVKFSIQSLLMTNLKYYPSAAKRLDFSSKFDQTDHTMKSSVLRPTSLKKQQPLVLRQML